MERVLQCHPAAHPSLGGGGGGRTAAHVSDRTSTAWLQLQLAQSVVCAPRQDTRLHACYCCAVFQCCVFAQPERAMQAMLDMWRTGSRAVGHWCVAALVVESATRSLHPGFSLCHVTCHFAKCAWALVPHCTAIHQLVYYAQHPSAQRQPFYQARTPTDCATSGYRGLILSVEPKLPTWQISGLALWHTHTHMPPGANATDV